MKDYTRSIIARRITYFWIILGPFFGSSNQVGKF